MQRGKNVESIEGYEGSEGREEEGKRGREGREEGWRYITKRGRGGGKIKM